MSKSPADPGQPGGSALSRVGERLQYAAATSVAAIVALNSAAFAKSEVVAQPQVTCIDACLPFLSPGALAATGTTIATLGAYALMRAKKSGRPPGDEEKKP